MNQGKFFTAAAGFLASGLLWAVAVEAQDRVIINPKIATAIQYNSNFWKAENNETGVYSYYAGPGILVGYETPKLTTSLDATLDLFWFDDQDTPPPGTRDASDDDYVGATLLGRVNYQATDRLNLGISDRFYVTRDPAEADINSDSITRDKYILNFFQPEIYYVASSRIDLRAAYRNTITDYEEDLEDSVEHRGIFDFIYNLNSRAATFLSYQIWARDYDQDSYDYTSNQVWLNYRHQIRYFTVNGGGGYHKRTFDGDNLGDLDLFSWGIQITGQDPDTNRRTTRSWVNFNFGQDMNDAGNGNDYYTASYLRLETGYRFIENLEASVRFAYQNRDYDFRDQDDDVYGGALRLAYRVRDFVTFGIEGGFENRDSNIPGLNYDDTFALLTMDINWDLGSR